jgi:hypothetical protein
MINIDFSNKKIRVETKKVSTIFKTPLKLSVQSHVTKKEIWSSELNDGWWAEFPNNEMNDVVITDNDGKVIANRNWNVIQDGDLLYKSLYFYCLNIFNRGRMPKGIAIGTHDGLFGEWVPCVLEGITEAILVEASKPQFDKLKENFEKFYDVSLVNSLITTDGKPVEFFEGGKGYTNSVVERVIRGWEKEEINSSIKESISINTLIETKVDWLHLDVEGYDIKLLMGTDPEKLPNLIIFEYENSKEDENSQIKQYLTNLGYELDYSKVSCLALKKN